MTVKLKEIMGNSFIDFLGVNEKELEADNDAKKAKYQYVNDSDYEYVLDSEGNSCREDIDNLKEEDTEDVYALKISEDDKEKYIEALEADEIRFEDNDESEDDKALIRFENKRAWKQGIAIQAKQKVNWEYTNQAKGESEEKESEKESE